MASLGSKIWFSQKGARRFWTAAASGVLVAPLVPGKLGKLLGGFEGRDSRLPPELHRYAIDGGRLDRLNCGVGKFAL